jgi:hypothetical protein
VKLEIKIMEALVGTYLLCLRKCFFGLSQEMEKSFSIVRWGIVGMHQKSLPQAALAELS